MFGRGRMKIQILSPEIGYPNEKMNHDFWVRTATNKAIVALGHEALPPSSREIADIQVVFAGMEFARPRYKTRLNGKFRAVWMYSRPSEMKTHVQRLKNFDKIYSLTSRHAEVFKGETGLVTKPLRIVTNKEHRPGGKYAFDIAYMGTKVDYRVKAIIALAHRGYKIVVAGYGWTKGRLHKNIHVAGQFWPNNQFSEFYNQAPLSIYPIREEYATRGIVPIRIIDIYASSDCMCLCSINPGLAETFAIPPPQYEDVAGLVRMVEFYMDNPTKRKEQQTTIRESLRKRTYQDLVLDVIVDAMNFWSQR